MDRRRFLTASCGAAIAASLRVRPSVSSSIVRPTGWGVCVPYQLVAQHGSWIAERELDILQPDAWHSYSIAPVCDHLGFVPVIYSDRLFDRDAVRQRMLEYPGETWMLFNEPERPEQAAMAPDRAVDVTMDFLRLAWETNTPMQWAGPGIATGMLDCSGIDWMTRYMRGDDTRPGLRLRGISRPTYWQVHCYRSPSLARFRSSWSAWQDWYAVYGCGAPIILSEACAEDAPLAEQVAVMRECRSLLDQGSVAGVFWFSTHASFDTGWTNAALCSVDVSSQRVSLTELGRRWQESR